MKMLRAWVAIFVLVPAAAQTPAEPEWQTAAGGKMAFSVASVKRDTGGFRSPNFPLDASDAFRPVGGRFSANFALMQYITFAYKLSLTTEQRQSRTGFPPNVTPWRPRLTVIRSKIRCGS